MRVSVPGAERRQREQDEAGAAAPSPQRISPQGMLRLQATAGNQAVGRLMRVSKRARDKLPGRGVKVADMEAFQQAGGLSDADVDAMLRLSTEDLVAAMDLEPKRFKDCADDNVDQVFAFARSASKKPTTQGQRQAQPRDVLALDLVGKGVADSDASQWITSAGVGAVKQWAAGKSDAAVQAGAKLCLDAKAPATLADLDRLIQLDAGLQAYGEDVVLKWASVQGLERTSEALRETQGDHSVNYVQAYFALGVKATDGKTFKDLVRLKGRLADGGTAMRVYKADNEFVGAHDGNSRTGFLRYPFGGGKSVELHTHWNRSDCKIVSIHVKEGGDKSTELNAWPSHFFGEINAAVLTAHNAATGPLKATTEPANRALTL